jgi:hypothetical protein
MWTWVNKILTQFKPCFGNKRTFGWFVIIVVGLIIRTDAAGVASIVRALNLTEASYPLLLHFFRSENYLLSDLEWRWQKILSESSLLFRVRNMVVMIGDGVKQSKEGRYMPGVKKLRQNSENSSKGEYIFGHLFGGVGVVVGNTRQKLYCALVSLRLHDGVGAINGWLKDESYAEKSHVVKTIDDAARAALVFGPALLLLDRLYLTIPMLKALAKATMIKVVTKAKMNAKAYYHPEPKTKPGPGAKRKKGADVKVASLFETASESFTTVKARMYGKTEEVSYYCENLLWGDAWYQNLRFVLVWLRGKKTILVSTDLTLSPVEIIELYCHRFKIECAFRELKQVICGFGYRFWCACAPKLSRFKPNDFHQEQYKNIENERERELIVNAVKAVERFVFFGCVALGTLQMASLLFSSKFTGRAARFTRTPSKAVPSEAAVADYMRKTIFQLFHFFPNLPITAIIKSKQSDPYEFDFDLEA